MSNGQVIRFALAFLLMSIFICGSTFLLLRNRLGLTKKKNFWMAMGFAGIAILILVAPVVYRQFQADIDNPFQKLLQFSQYFLMGWVAINLLVFLGLEVIQAFINLARIPFKAEKRIFLTEGVARTVLATTSTLAVGGLVQAKMKPRISKVEIKLKTLPKSFDGFTIAQISDVHIGPLLHHEFLDGVVDDILALNPDAIAITGDLVDGTVDQLNYQIEPLKRLKAKHGVYFCTGNHEYYSGAESWIAHLESFGIHVFKNSNIVLERDGASGAKEKLLLAGVYDWQAGRYFESHQHDAKAAAETTTDAACKVLLAHNPFSTPDAASAGFHLQLSGHTHAGQFYPFAFIVKLALKYSEGLYQVTDDMQLYVNRGTGFWGPPNRLGVSSEITHVVLRSV